MLKKYITLVIGLCLSNLTLSQTIQDQEAAFRVVKNYANSVACGVDLSKNNVFEIDSSDYFKTYYVLWSGDKGCAGGSSTEDNFISTVQKNGNSPSFIVIDDDAFGDLSTGDQMLINTRFIESIKQIDNHTFEIISSNYADDYYGGTDGGNNFPANKFKYRLELINDDWVITHQRLLKQNRGY